MYVGMTHERKTRIWALWQQGVPLSHIARDIQKPPATVYSYLLYHGSIEPKIRKRRESFLSIEERKTKSRGIASGLSSVFTTAIFWGVEYAFHLIFGTGTMRYMGAVIGLALGFYIKYQLDKNYVFVGGDK